MIAETMNARILKLKSLIEKYEGIMSFNTITQERYIQVKAYIHCFNDELEFLQSIGDEPANQNSDFDNDDDEF